MTKYIIITGGVVSGIGKGTSTASIGRLVKNDHKIITIKCDGYLNVDPGTINPIEHGEVFVLHDGGEVDMDFGHYERFLDINCKKEWNITSGKVFNQVIENERRGLYLGKTIQIFPHVINEIKSSIYKIVRDEKADIVLIEIGGTIGDIENSWFIEAARQLKNEVGKDNISYMHVTYVPFLESVGEQKTKPAQRDVAMLREKGIQPDVLIARSRNELSQEIKQKLALFCDVSLENIISAVDIKSVYEIPLMFKKQGMDKILSNKLEMNETDLSAWEALVGNIKNPKQEVVVAVCGKYTKLEDSYASIKEALVHAGAHNGSKVRINWVETTDLEDKKISLDEIVKDVHGILVPGGFGSRGVEGKIEVIKHARENNIPYLGICYGLQLAVIEFARNKCGLAGAHTTEVDEKTPHPVIAFLPEQKHINKKGGTMRLGDYDALLKKDAKVYGLYNKSLVKERHRHRYEVNPDYHDVLQQNGMIFSGLSKDSRLVEFIELADHPFFVGTQAHNELTSRLEKPNPLFHGFVKAMIEYKNKK